MIRDIFMHSGEGFIGVSAVLPEDDILKKQAVLLDHIVCDDLSVHIVQEGEARSAREFKADMDAAYGHVLLSFSGYETKVSFRH
jgi:hypothetical protein